MPQTGHAIHTVQRPSARRRIAVSIIILTAVVLFLALAVVGWFVHDITTPVGGKAAPQIVTIASGASVAEIGKQLQEAGLIRNKAVFELYARLGSARGQLRPGPYELKPTMSLVQIVDYLAAGKIAVHTFVAKDGMTLTQLATSYEQQGIGSASDLTVAIAQTPLTPALTAAFNTPKTLEGFLLADSYQLAYNEPASALVTKMLTNFEKKALPLFKGPNPNKLSNYQVLTVASISEKEASLKADRAGVAGVFYNRLLRGMRLESDVTVIYITGKQAEPTAAELNIDSPYNTRRNFGLPPTPINSPSLSAIEASLSPTASDYLFFIGGKDGKVYYATTYTEHNENIRLHLK